MICWMFGTGAGTVFSCVEHDARNTVSAAKANIGSLIILNFSIKTIFLIECKYRRITQVYESLDNLSAQNVGSVCNILSKELHKTVIFGLFEGKILIVSQFPFCSLAG